MEADMFHRSSVVPLLVSVFFSIPYAAPRIQFDTTTFDCGTVIAGKTDKLNATFVVKNTGDALLRLEKVRPGCGCTVVKYDSLIEPGKSAKIESQVRIKGYHPGQLSKGITVTSNAANTPTVRLKITATIRSLIDISDRYVSLSAGDTTMKKLFVTSKKNDLKITAVSFGTETDQANQAGGTWQAKMPIPVKFSWAPADSTTADGYHIYQLILSAPDIDTLFNGKFRLTTNHPEMPEIILPGTLTK
jgi:hypothetical protein